MSFYDVVFPEFLSYGSKSGRSFSTAISESDGGFERRSAEWQPGRHRMQFDVAKSVQSEDDLGVLMDFYLCMRGSACGFRFKDVTDFSTSEDGVSLPSSIADAHPATAMGTSTESYQMRKQYRSSLADGAQAFDRPITRPIPPGYDDHRVLIFWGGQLVWRSIGSGPETMALGVQAAVDYTNGRVVFNSTPQGDVQIACTFHVPARFGQEVDDELTITRSGSGTFEIDTLPIVEITGDPNSGEEEWKEGGVTSWSGSSTGTYGYSQKDFREDHNVVTATIPSAYYLPQFLTNATGGPSMSFTPLVSGENWTGGPMTLVSSSASSTDALDVRQQTVTGNTTSVVATLNANQYVELYWVGNPAVGQTNSYKSR